MPQIKFKVNIYNSNHFIFKLLNFKHVKSESLKYKIIKFSEPQNSIFE